MTTPTLTNSTEGQDAGRQAPPGRKGHIGLIVAASLVAGLLAAIVLVVGPFGGAQEDTISGVALLGFAFGWALLAVLSIWRTDQPQRWAMVPAVAMAGAGISLLVFEPSNDILNVLGWAWPAVLIALVVWMIIHARHDLRSRTRPWLLYPVFGLLLLAGLGGAFETVKESLDRSAYAMPGRLIDVGDHKLHIHCTGSGSPTVVLEPGLGEPSVMMAGWIAPAVSRTTRVCVYDRAGRGWSEFAPHPRDGVGAATDLHTLLTRAHIPGPYVLVGHSSGGVYVRIFSARYPAQVAGIVLLDSQPDQAFTKLPDFPAFYNVFRRVEALQPSLSRMGVGRLIYLSAVSDLPPRARSEERAFWSTAGEYRSVRDEFAELPTALKQADQLRSFGHKPLIAVTAGKDADAGWMPLQNEMAALSTNSLHRVFNNVTHASLTEDKNAAAISIQAIRDVATSVRSLKPLNGGTNS